MDPIVKVFIKRVLDKLELVDRTEFDAQREVLAKAINRAKELEKEVDELSREIERLSLPADSKSSSS